MTILGAALNSSAQQLRVDAAVADPADYYKIDSEVVQLLSHRQASAAYLAGDPTLWRVERGVAGTTAASHLNGATLTALYPQIALSPVESAGGGGVSVTGITGDTVNPATGLRVANVTADGDTAVLASVIISPTEPLDTGGSQFWLQTGAGVNSGQLWARRADDSEWEQASSGMTRLLADYGPTVARQVGAYDSANGSVIGLNVDPASRVAELVTVSSDGQISASARVTDAFIAVSWSGNNFFSIELSDAGIKMRGLPTSDPGTGNFVWNSGGTLKVTAA